MGTFDTFPDEIWVQILKIHITKEIESRTYMDIDIFLPLMLVSSLWFRRIQNTPTLWTDIFVGKFEENQEMKLFLALNLSRNANLSLYLAREREINWEIVRPLLLPARHRITSVGMLQHTAIGTQLFEDLLTFPAIKSLYYFSSYETLGQAFLDSLPSLTGINGCYIRGDEVTSLPIGLRSLSTYSPLHVVLPLIKDLHSLKEVSFSSYLSEEPGRLPCSVSEELGWTHLTFKEWNYEGSKIILPKVARNLVYLNLTIDIQSLVDFFLPILYEFKQLTHLKLSIDENGGEQTLDLLPPTWVSSIQIFSANYRCDPISVTPTLNRVNSFFRYTMRHIRELEINATNPQFIHFLQDNHFIELKKLTVINKTSLAEYQSIHMASLVANNTSLMSILLDVPSSEFPLFTSSTVERLAIKNLSNVHHSKTSPSDFSHWSNIITLDIGRLVHPFGGFDLPYLKKLIIGDIRESERWNYSLGGITDFCANLALDPTRCPYLEHLESASYPEWDIFFLMLERRNFLLDSSISRLKHIALPKKTTHSLRQLIRSRLKGQMTQRPSNYQLSMIGNLDLVYDLNVAGCFTCLRGIRTCQEIRIKYSHPEENMDMNPPQFEYPIDDDAILSTWSERIPLKWETLGNVMIPDYCDFNTGPLVHITDTSEDEPTYDKNYTSWIPFSHIV